MEKALRLGLRQPIGSPAWPQNFAVDPYDRCKIHNPPSCQDIGAHWPIFACNIVSSTGGSLEAVPVKANTSRVSALLPPLLDLAHMHIELPSQLNPNYLW